VQGNERQSSLKEKGYELKVVFGQKI